MSCFRMITSRAELHNALLPVDFFSVKKIPRGNMFLMRLLAFLVLASTLVTFVYIAYDTSHQVVTTTEIQTEDLTGQQGWDTCTMISKVTNSYADVETAGSFDLVNVMESKNECSANLATSNPCETFTVPETVGTVMVEYDIKAFSFDPAGTLYFVSESGLVANFFTVYKYDPARGVTTTITDSLAWSDLTFCSMQRMKVSSTGIIYLFGDTLEYRSSALSWFDQSTATSSSLTDFFRSFVLDSNDVGWFMRTETSDSDSSLTVSIFQFDSTTPSSAKTLKFRKAEIFDNSPGLDWTLDETFDMNFDVSGNLWAYWPANLGGGSGWDYTLYKIGSHMSTPAASVRLYIHTRGSTLTQLIGSTVIHDSVSTPPSITLSKYDSNAELVSTVVVPDYLTGFGDFDESPSGDVWYRKNYHNPNFNKVDKATGEITSLKSYASAVFEWFVCGSEFEATVPNSEETLNTACMLNGVKWAAARSSYSFFSDAEFASFSASPTCDSTLYTRICDVVGVLPPYVCTKEESIELTTYLGVAAANAELLYAFLVFLCGFVFAITSSHGDQQDGPENNMEDVKTAAGLVSNVKVSAIEIQELKVMSTAKDKKIAALEMQMARMENLLEKITVSGMQVAPNQMRKGQLKGAGCEQLVVEI